MREYRQRKKLKKYDMGKVIDPTLPVECRACLEKFNDGGELLDLFQPWATSWDGMGETIAQDLAQIANVDISRTDEFSKLICQYCYQKLLEACCFVANVRVRDRMLRQQVETPNNDSAWPKPIQVNEIIKKDILNTPMEIGIKQEVPDEEAYTTSVEKTTKEVEDSECFKTYSYVEVKVEPENIASPPIYSDNESTTPDDLEDNCNAIFSNHKSIKVEREYDATSENIQAVAMSLKKEFDDDESAECGDFNPCALILEETQSDSNSSTQTTRRLDMTETNSDQNASTSGAVPRRGDKKAAERSRLYRKRHKEEINQRRRDIRHQIQNAQIPSTDEIDQIIQTSPNQLRLNSHTRRQQRYYERHKDEINKRKRDKRQQQSVKSVPATTAERNKKYRERNKQIINERRRDSRQRLKLSCEYLEQFNSDYIQHPLLNPNYS